jgi:hypothetical protein
MGATETVAALAAFEPRGAGTDAERRAALWLAKELSHSGREARVEPFWCRPNWAFAHAWHVALGLAGSIVSVYSARVGGAVLLVALLSMIADAFTGTSLGRRLTPEHASQNIAAVPDERSGKRIHLIVTANYDAGRTGLAYREALRAAAASIKRASRGLSPGWLGWLTIAIVWLLVVAILRLEGDHGKVVGAIQLVPTAALVIALAGLLEIASAGWSPAAGDNATGVAVAVALTRALDAAPPGHLSVELVLQGAADATATGLRKHLRARKRQLSATNVVVLGIAPCSVGRPRWWVSDGPLVPLRYFRRLGELCGSIATREPHLDASPHKGRGTTAALPARGARLPAITIGCLDERGLVPLSHRRSDVPDAVDSAAMDAAVAFGLMLVDAIDEFVASSEDRGTPIPA